MKHNNPQQQSDGSTLPEVLQNLARNPIPTGNTTPTLDQLDVRLRSAVQQIDTLTALVIKLSNILQQDHNGTIRINSPGSIELNAGSAITMEAETFISLEAGETVRAETSHGAKVKLSIAVVNIEAPYKINVDSGGQLNIEANTKIECESPSVKVLTPSLQHEGATCKSSGLVQCDALKANTVTAMSIAPAAGNIW